MDDKKDNTYAEEGGNKPGERTERDRLEEEKQAQRDGGEPSGEAGGVPAEEREAFDAAHEAIDEDAGEEAADED